MDKVLERYTRRVIEAQAEWFRDQYLPGVRGPINPDPIIEFDLGMSIIPIEHVMRNLGTRAWLSACGGAIIVDRDFQDIYPRDYASLMLHEVGHKRLHAHLLPKGPFTSAQSFVEYHRSLGEVDVSYIEAQARLFGLYTVMPSDELETVFAETVEFASDWFPKLRSYPAREFVAARVAAHFGVSVSRAHDRIRLQGCWRKYFARQFRAASIIIPPFIPQQQQGIPME